MREGGKSRTQASPNLGPQVVYIHKIGSDMAAQMGAEHVTDRLLHKSVSDMAAQMGAERVTDRLLYLSDGASQMANGASQMATDRGRSSREIGGGCESSRHAQKRDMSLFG